jgi:hypothetical protein
MQNTTTQLLTPLKDLIASDQARLVELEWSLHFDPEDTEKEHLRQRIQDAKEMLNRGSIYMPSF